MLAIFDNKSITMVFIWKVGMPKFSCTAPIALSITNDLLNSAKLNESKFLGLIKIPPSLTSKL